MTEDARVRAVEQEEVADDKNQTDLGGAQFPVRDLEYPERVGCQVGVDRQHQENDQRGRGDSLRHVTGKCEPEDQEHGAEGVDDVVYIKTVAGTLPISVARQGSVQAVAKPVEKYAEIHEVQQQRVPPARRVEHAGQKHSHQSEQREVIGIYPRRHAARESSKRRSFKRRQNTRLLSRGILETAVLHLVLRSICC